MNRIVGMLLILAVICGAVLLAAGEARAQTLEVEPPATSPAPGDATAEPATTEPVPSTDATLDPVPETPPPTSDPTPMPAPDPVAEPAPEPEPVFVAEPTPVIEPAPAPDPVIVPEPAPEPVIQDPAPQPAPETTPDPITVPDPAPAPEPVIVPEPPPVLDPAPVIEPTVESVPPPTTSEMTPVPVPEPASLDPATSEPVVSPAPIEPVPAPALAEAQDPAPTAAPVTPVAEAFVEPDTAPVSDRTSLAAPALVDVLPAEPPIGPPEGDGRAPKVDAAFAAPITDAADPPADGFGGALLLGHGGNKVANLPQSLANRLLETASALFGSASQTVASITRQTDRMATVLQRASTRLIENLTDEPDNPVPAQPTQNPPSPAVPPAPVPVPAGSGVSCSSSGGSWECQNDAHYALLIGALAGALALGIPKGSGRFFHEILKPNSILPQVAERPG
ncbi:MAG TPA: hypothetical protein VHM16_09220 [Rubrobacteraceae bacterium]|nr:hypothetical protein [Rubrobacteraceae bacterium]